MKAGNVQLRREVYRSDACLIIDWLEDDEIIKYLNEHQNVTNSILQVINRVNMPVLTHLFNQNGSFFVVDTEDNKPVGFLRLVPKQKEAEMVIVIGDKDKWGRGLGTNAIKHGLKHAFFEWRVEKVIAKINVMNVRSIKVFEKAGFKHEKRLPREMLFSITMDEYIKLVA
jgi:RimJ/RimL family protein N-acetyltransferase